MKHRLITNYCLSLTDGSIDPVRKDALLKHLSHCPPCSKAFREYYAVNELEKIAARSIEQPGPELPVKILDRIEEQQNSQALPDQLQGMVRWLVGGLVSANITLFVVLISLISFERHRTSNYFSSTFERNFQETAQLSDVGYRRVSVAVDTFPFLTSSVEPNSRVEVLWRTTQQGKELVIPVDRFARVISVERVNNKSSYSGGEQPEILVTLLVRELAAFKLDIAQDMGGIILATISPQGRNMITQVGPLRDPEGRIVSDQTWVNLPAILYTNDARTGRMQRFVHREGKWEQDAGLELVDL